MTKMEKELETWMKSYTKLSCPPPIGTQNQEPMEDDELEEDEEGDDDDHDNEDSDSRVEDDVEFEVKEVQEEAWMTAGSAAAPTAAVAAAAATAAVPGAGA